MSRWTHALCVACWNKIDPSRPVSVSEYVRGYKETCCYCGKLTDSGIYLRGNPDEVPCKGQGSPHTDSD